VRDKQEIKLRKPDIVITEQLQAGGAKIAKDIDKTIKVVLGGVHAYIYPYETINLPNG